MTPRNVTGTVGIGVLGAVVATFAYSALDTSFGPIAVFCIAGGTLVAAIRLLRRQPKPPSIDADRQTDAEDPTARGQGKE
jgi:hypothetical protein